MITNKKTARIVGFGYLIIISAGHFAKFLIRSTIIVPGDSQTRANSVMASEWPIRIGFASNLIVLICDVVVALTLYILLKPVNKSLVLLAAFFRFVQTAIYGINLLNQFFTLILLSGANYSAESETDGLHSIHLKSFPSLQIQI
jgi:hypothetical protein